MFYALSLYSVRSLYLSHNSLTGTVPGVLPKSMTYLTLQTNFLNGTVPFALKRLKDMDSLILSNNSFSGTIPLFITSLTKLSENNKIY
mgnify:FL=1